MAAVFTNLSVYLAIAEEALVESKRLLEAGRRPKPEGQPGYILSPDPQQKSFKQSLIAIAFAGMYLEALLSLIGRARWGIGFYDERIDRRFTYEEKLKLLGIVDQSDLDSCTRSMLAPFLTTVSPMAHCYRRPLAPGSPIAPSCGLFASLLE